MANKLYKEEDVARIAKRINSYTGLNKGYKLSEMADGVDEAVRVGDISTGVLKGLIERSLTELNIPLGTTRIGSYAFEQYRALTKITIPETVTKILNHAFHDCTGLTDIVIPDSVTEIGTSLFHGCNNLASIRLSDGIEILPTNCFYQCSKLAKVTLPASLKKLEGSSLATTGNGIFDFTKCEVVPVLASGALPATLSDGARIYVPARLYDAWVVATNWAKYAEHIVAVYSAPEIPNYGYVSEGLEYSFTGWNYEVIGRGSCNDSVIVIPETYDDGKNGERRVVRINGIGYMEGQGAFENDQNIEEIVLPEHRVDIYYQALRGSSLKILRNFSGGDSFWSQGLNLEYVSMIDGTNITNYEFFDVSSGVTLDFSRHTSVPELSDVSYINAHEGLRILVPMDLYDEWVADDSTNWVALKEYIFPAK